MTTPTKTFTLFIQMASLAAEQGIQELGFIPTLQPTEENGPPTVFSYELGDDALSVPTTANNVVLLILEEDLAWKSMWIQ